MSSIAQPTLSKQSENVFTKNRFVGNDDDDPRTKLEFHECPSRRHRPSPVLSQDERRFIRHLRGWSGIGDLRRLAKWRRHQEERSE